MQTILRENWRQSRTCAKLHSPDSPSKAPRFIRKVIWKHREMLLVLLSKFPHLNTLPLAEVPGGSLHFRTPYRMNTTTLKMLHRNYLHVLVASRCIHLLCKHQSLAHPQCQEPTCLSKPGKCQRHQAQELSRSRSIKSSPWGISNN